MAIQALQPRVKEIQERYKGRDPQEAQVSKHNNITTLSPNNTCPAFLRS